MAGSVRWLIAGLGNPGDRYLPTRHNLGFWTLDVLRCRVAAGPWRLHGPMLAARGVVDGQQVVLIKPLRWMNLSGGVVATALSSWCAAVEHLVVVCDDVALPDGRIRIRSGGSSGGHKGIDSIIDALGSQSFIRVRIGVGSGRPPGRDLSAYVLEPMAGGEMMRYAAVCGRAAEEIEFSAARGSFAPRTVDVTLPDLVGSGAHGQSNSGALV